MKDLGSGAIVRATGPDLPRLPEQLGTGFASGSE